MKGIDIKDIEFYYIGQTTEIVKRLTNHYSKFGDFSKKRSIKELNICYILVCEDYEKREKEYIRMKPDQLKQIIENASNKEIIEILNKVSGIRKSDKIIKKKNRHGHDIVENYTYQLSKNPFLTINDFFNQWSYPSGERDEYWTMTKRSFERSIRNALIKELIGYVEIIKKIKK